MIRKLLLTSMILLATILFSNGFAGTTGKITGKVTDSETGEPLPGINIMIDGTTMGAASGLDGTFLINNIPPGKYDVVASGVGFQKKKFVGVKVNADYTTRLDIEMSTEVITTGEVIVRAEAPMVRKDLTSSHTSVDAEQIETLPVESVSGILSLQAGITQGTGGELHIRGGRSNEIAYTVNGVSISNPYNNGNSVSIATNAIQELSVVSGTFNAEYGNALSGIVNTVTKEGGEDYKGSFSFYTGDYLSTRTEIFDHIDDIDPMNNYVGEMTLGGPIPLVNFNNRLNFFVSGRYSSSDGYLYGERQHLPTDYVWKSPQNPDSIVILQNGDGAIVPMNTGWSFSGTGKLTFKPIPTIKINYDALYSRSEGQGYSHAYKYNPDANPTGYDWGLLNSLELRHALSNTTFYSLQASYNVSDYQEYLYPLLNRDGSEADFHAGIVLDTTKYRADPRYQPDYKSEPARTNTFLSGGTSNGHFYQRTYTMGAKFDVTSQVTNNHEVKFGLEYENHELNYESFSVQRDTTTFLVSTIQDVSTNTHDSYQRKPVEFSTYIQDKMEFDDLIVNLGVRYDYFDADAVYGTSTIYPSPNDLERIPAGFDTSTLLAEADAKHQVSPRLGVSFPITDKGIIHFSYGHFFQMPPFSYLYTNPNFEYFGTPTYGNANLRPEKTVTYEIGLQQGLSDNIAFHITGYYKDVRDLLALQRIRADADNEYYKYVNKDYANIRGIIFSINKRRTATDMLGFSIDYTFQVAEGNDTDSDSFFLDIESGRQSEKVPVYLNWDKSHQLNATISVGDPGNWNATLVGRVGTGLPYDPVLYFQDIYLKPNSGRRPSQANVDLLAEKTFEFAGYNFVLFAKVFNLFDILNENSVYGSTGRSGYALETTFADVKTTDEIAQLINGMHSASEYYVRPNYYLAPRQVRLGLSVEF